MSLESRFRHILAAFGERIPATSGGAIFRPRAPIDLPSALGPVAARRLAATRIERLFDFGVPTSSHGDAAALGMLWIGDSGGLICASMPRRSPVALAALLPAAEPRLLSDFLSSFMARNGRRFGVNFLQGLPLWIRNRRPDLVDRRAMKRAMWAWVTWAHRHRVTSWQTFAAKLQTGGDAMNGQTRFRTKTAGSFSECIWRLRMSSLRPPGGTPSRRTVSRT